MFEFLFVVAIIIGVSHSYDTNKKFKDGVQNVLKPLKKIWRKCD